MLIFFRLYCMVIRTLPVAVIFSSSQGSLRNDKVGLLCFVVVVFLVFLQLFILAKKLQYGWCPAK